MVTTRIMPLHIGKGRTASSAISDIIDYVQNPDKTDVGELIIGYACDSRIVDAEFMLAKREYISLTGRVRGVDDAIGYHLCQSFVPEEITPEEANRIDCELARCFTKGNNALAKKPESLEDLYALLQQEGNRDEKTRQIPFPESIGERTLCPVRYAG